MLRPALPRLLLLVLAAASVAALPACSGGGGSDGVAKVGDLVVRVADARQPGTSLAGASVTVTAGKVSRSATTAADGLVTFRDLPAGPATVQVTRDLYQDYSLTGTVQGASAVGLTALLQRRTGQINAKALDAFQSPVPNVQLRVDVEGQSITAVTDAAGMAVLASVPTAAVNVQALASGFEPEPTQSVVVVESPAASIVFALDRQTEPGGGVLVPRPPVTPPLPPGDGGQTLTFTIRTVVVDGQGRAIGNLPASAFTLLACADSVPSVAECVRSPTDPAFDAAYAPVGTAPDALVELQEASTAPYAVALLYDQSGSMSASDPTDARVFSSKGFLQTVAPGDRVVLSAFADGTAALIPSTPLTVFGSFTNDGASFFDELDQLPGLEGGSTPLYQALDLMLAYTAANAPTGIAGQRKAVVLFTDGFDTGCADPVACREQSIARSRALGVDIYTIGLADSADASSLAELALRTNGAYLVAANPEQLSALYGSLGALLRGTTSTYETTWTVRAGSAGAFASGRSVLGTVRVATGENTLELPFFYTIP